MTTVATPETLTLEQRTEALNRYTASAAQAGWRVVSQTPTQAQLVKGKPTNHILHLILSIITLGIWLIVWLAMVLFAGEKQKFVTVDEYGRIV